MILELDCGNTLIKWRLLAGAGGAVLYAGCAHSDAELLEQLDRLPELIVRWCRLVSVRSDAETRQTLDVLRARYAMRILQASVSSRCAGVSNGYRDCARLGLDRWLAIVAAYHLAGKACLVLDLGTAVTADLVDSDGEHLGGYICPGLPLMRAQLRTHTRRIRYDDGEALHAARESAPGRSTAEAVERGCVQMLRGFVALQCAQAREFLGDDFEVFLTGGDAAMVAGVWPAARVVADLVFSGLALACPIEGE